MYHEFDLGEWMIEQERNETFTETDKSIGDSWAASFPEEFSNEIKTPHSQR